MMNIPNTLVEELKLYLKHRSENGDLEAKTLLTQIEQFSHSTSDTIDQTDYYPPDGLDLGC